MDQLFLGVDLRWTGYHIFPGEGGPVLGEVLGVGEGATEVLGVLFEQVEVVVGVVESVADVDQLQQ